MSTQRTPPDATSAGGLAATVPHLGARLAGLAACVRVGAALGALALVGMAGAVLWAPAEVLAWVLGSQGNPLLPLVQGPLTAAIRWRLLAVMLPGLLLSLSLLWQLWSLFGHYRRGEVFGPMPLRRLHRIGWLLMALALTEPITRALGSVAASWDNPPGHRMLVVTWGSQDYIVLLAALVWLAVVRVMAEATRVADDHAQIV